MTPQVTESFVVSQSPQQNGTFLVVERHVITDEFGSIAHTQSYYAASEDLIQPILQARAAKMQEELDRREAIEAEARNFELPLHKTDFRKRYTPAEQGRVTLFYLRYLDSVDLTDEQKGEIAAGIKFYEDAKSIYLSDPLTVAAVQMQAALGLLDAPERVNEILGIS